MTRRRGFDPLSWALALVTALLFGSRTARMAALVPVVLLFVVWANLRVWWWELGPVRQWLVGVAVLALVAAYVWWRSRGPGRRLALSGRRRPAGGQLSVRGAEGGWLPRTPHDPEWLYRFTEFRYDRTDELAPRVWPGQPIPRGVTEHLVYLGITHDAEKRYLQHIAKAGWYHDQIRFVAEEIPTRDDVEELEQLLIGEAARRVKLSDRPRENREYNPTYDPERCRYMRAKAAESRVIREALAGAA